MDLYEWLRFSLLIASFSGLLAAKIAASKLLKQKSPGTEDDSSKEGWAIFFMIFIMCMLSYAAAQLNKYLGHPFT
jgi:hypothetical protein